MTWTDGTKIHWHGYGHPSLVALAERENEREKKLVKPIEDPSMSEVFVTIIYKHNDKIKAVTTAAISGQGKTDIVGAAENAARRALNDFEREALK